MSLLSPEMIPGLTVKPPTMTPQPGQVIIGYERFRHEAACCDCEGLTQGGIIAIVVLLLLCWPLAFIPCCMEDCREEYQRPVYGSPGQGVGGGVPYAQVP